MGVGGTLLITQARGGLSTARGEGEPCQHHRHEGALLARWARGGACGHGYGGAHNNEGTVGGPQKTQSTEQAVSAKIPSEPRTHSPPLLAPRGVHPTRGDVCWQLPTSGISDQETVTRTPDRQGQRDMHVFSPTSSQVVTIHKPPHRNGYRTMSSVTHELSLAPAVW